VTKIISLAHLKPQLSKSFCLTNRAQRLVCWTSKSDLHIVTKFDQILGNDYEFCASKAAAKF